MKVLIPLEDAVITHMSSGYQVNRKDIIKMLGPVEATPQCEGEAANFFRCMGANGDDDRKCMVRSLKM